MRPIPRMKAVSARVVLGSAGSKIKFGPVPELDGATGVRILGVCAYTDAQYTPDQNGSTVISATEALGVCMTFADGSDQRFMQVPYTDLVRQLNAGTWFEFPPDFAMDFQKSFGQCNGTVTAGVAIVLVFMYATVADISSRK